MKYSKMIFIYKGVDGTRIRFTSSEETATNIMEQFCIFLKAVTFHDKTITAALEHTLQSRSPEHESSDSSFDQ